MLNYLSFKILKILFNIVSIVKVDIGKITTLCSLLDSMLTFNKDVDTRLDESKLRTTVCTTFVFCYVWSIGGNLRSTSWDSFDTFVRNQFDEVGDAKVNI